MQRARMRIVTWAVVAAMLVAVLAVAAPAFGQVPMETVIYRFYNQGTGTHFYTASLEERDYVIATWPSVFTYEGPAFSIFAEGWFPPDLEPARTQVYRFYNKANKSHFYTISSAEADMVKAKYPALYTYEGPAFEAYAESNDWAPLMPVHRFYNLKNGSHFYTISATEKAILQLQYRDVYRYEGVSFYAIMYGYYGI